MDLNLTGSKNKTVGELLAGIAGKRVFLYTPRGNRGDELIVLGISAMMRRAGVIAVDTPADADHILIKGGGVFIRAYLPLVQEVCGFINSHKNTPVTILPTSYGLADDQFASHIESRCGELTVFAREQKSFELLRNSGLSDRCILYHDHDSAFALNGSSWFEGLKIRKRPRHILVVERGDAEALICSSGSRNWDMMRSFETLAVRLTRLMPGRYQPFIRDRIVRPLMERADSETAFAAAVRRYCQLDLESKNGLKYCVRDISDPSLCTFNGFCDYICQSSTVVTTRLHVGILSAMLNIPTIFIDGVYHKIRGVYEYSMKNWDHVRCLNQSELIEVASRNSEYK